MCAICIDVLAYYIRSFDFRFVQVESESVIGLTACLLICILLRELMLHKLVPSAKDVFRFGR